MSYTLTTMDEGHIILLTMGEDFVFPDEMIESMVRGYDLLEAGPGSAVFLVDSRLMRFDSLEKILGGGQAARSPESQRFQAHPRYLKAITVVSSQLVKTVVKGFNSASFGNLEIPVYDTFEDALNAARNMVNAARKTG